MVSMSHNRSCQKRPAKHEFVVYFNKKGKMARIIEIRRFFNILDSVSHDAMDV